VVGVQHPQTVSEQPLQVGDRAGRITSFPPPPGEIVPSGQGVGMVGAQHPQTVSEQLLEGRSGADGITGDSPPVGDVAAADSPAGLLRAGVAETPFRDRPELEVLRRWYFSSPWSSIRLVAGPGGQGKTRLARPARDQAGRPGVGQRDAAERVTEAQIAVLAQVRVPTLIAVEVFGLQRRRRSAMSRSTAFRSTATPKTLGLISI
jgi:hypothetical protein